MDSPMATQEIKKVILNLPKDLWRKVRMAAAAEDKTLTDLVRDWLTERIAERETEHPTPARRLN